MMESWWKAILLLSVATAVNSLSLTQEINSIQDVEYIKRAVDIYNKKENINDIFKPLDDDNDTYLQVDENLLQLVFKIKETVCPKSENYNIGECDFKPDGEVRVCYTYLTEQKNEDAIITCSSLSQHSRAKRSFKKRFKKFFRKVEKKIRPVVKKILEKGIKVEKRF
ncbi:cathelicidin-6-like [Ascaphus truei]|uniref:cathelicidin-6-like n=1 Tax=Ascaphus truei TaxID=8439 RepID=UPI003F5A8AAD